MSTAYPLLLHGHDTIECAYYLEALPSCSLDFERLAVEKEALRLAKVRRPKAIQLGSEEFLLMPNGTKSGYPFLIENDCFSIQFGEFNKPNFFVTYRSFALWQFGAMTLHRRFLAWAASVGFTTFQPERLSRVDFTFDYQIETIDFDEDSFVSSATKDNQHRKNRKVQTFRFGEGELMLRIYNKVDEIQEKSAKTWFFDLWGCEENVWRIEWQVRKEWLRIFGIRTFVDLEERQGDLLRVLVNDHTTLRIKTADSNRSRWPLHPLWQDLQAQVAKMDGLGIVKELDPVALLEEREMRIAISVYGYELLSQLGEIKESANVSRIDLFVDFQTSENMESWDRHAWVTRASSINAYAVSGNFSGWSIGLGGVISARLYNKLLEIVVSGKDWILPLWQKAGWETSGMVWRLEFELKREVLTQKGLPSGTPVPDRQPRWPFVSPHAQGH